ncbi:MAG: 4-hydroxy-tetrahydrodipicolinate reductase [Alphaproteobacteria bacterium]|nr:MAG: 4-hydroxy-tetrahydrodipicolinate reductase [Alphaproteobacteria bacterium]
MAETRIGVIGCGGRMGRMLIADIVATEGCELSGGVARSRSASLGQDLGELAGIGRLGLTAGEDVRQVGRPIVIGTTGLTGEQEKAIHGAAERIPVVWAANTSLGINLLFGLVEQVAARLGPEWDIEIMEMHHRGKVDAPSGTALALGRTAAAARGDAFEEVAQRGRDGITGPRKSGAIGFAALRGGDNIGEHHVMFAGVGERLELVHRATNRAIYAKGAVRAARWLIGRPPGLYGMKEVLGL